MRELQKADVSEFWYWIVERHAIFLKKENGMPKPWTNDPILRHYKFTNPFRENDKGTVWLRENFLVPHRQDKHDKSCDPYKPCTCNAVENLQLLLFNICWYRAFNWTGTGKILGWQTDWKPDEVRLELTRAQKAGYQIFTGAHIIRGEHGRPKIDSIVDVCSDVWNKREELTTLCRHSRSLQLVWDRITDIPYIGPFQGYEMVTDMRHTRLLEDATDIMTWANAGPGAKRGLERLGRLWETPALATASMSDLLKESLSGLPEGFPALEMRDIEHSLCEFDKYCRAKFGEGAPRSRYPGER